MAEIHVEDAYTISSMRFLLTMKAFQAIIINSSTDPDIAELDVIIAQNPHLAAPLTRVRRSFLENKAHRVEASFACNLVDAPYLEVNDVSSSEYVRYLREKRGWTGMACYDENLDGNLKDDVRKVLGDVPCRVKRIMEDGRIVLVPLPPEQMEQHSQDGSRNRYETRSKKRYKTLVPHNFLFTFF